GVRRADGRADARLGRWVLGLVLRLRRTRPRMTEGEAAACERAATHGQGEVAACDRAATHGEERLRHARVATEPPAFSSAPRLAPPSPVILDRVPRSGIARSRTQREMGGRKPAPYPRPAACSDGGAKRALAAQMDALTRGLGPGSRAAPAAHTAQDDGVAR